MSWNKPEFGKSASDTPGHEGLDADHAKWLEESGMAQAQRATARHETHPSYADEYETHAQRSFAPNSQEAAMNEVAQALSRLMQTEQGRPHRQPAKPAVPHRDPWHRSDLRTDLDQSASPYAYEDHYDPEINQHPYARAGVARDPLMHPRPPLVREAPRHYRAPVHSGYAPHPSADTYAEPALRHEPARPRAPERAQPAGNWFAPAQEPDRLREAETTETSKVKRISSVLDALNALDERLNSLAHNENEKGRGMPVRTNEHAAPQQDEPAHREPQAPSFEQPPVSQLDPSFNRGAVPHGVTPGEQHNAAASQTDNTAQISDLNTMIDGHFKQLAEQLDTLRGPDQQQLDQLHEGMQTQMNSLRDEMMERTSDNRAQLSEIIGRLRDDEGNGLLLKELRHELEQMKSALSRSDVEESLNALGIAHESIQSRLQDLADKNVDPAIYESLSQRMGEVETQIRQLPRVDQLNALENRLSSMGDRLEDVLHRSGASGLEAVREEVTQLRKTIDRLDSGRMIHEVDQRIRFLTARMDELDHFSAIQRDIQSRLSTVETRMPDGEVIDRLHGRLDSISSILAEGPEHAGHGDQLNRLEERLSNIGEQLDRMERSPENAEGFDKSFTMIEGRLDHICDKMDGIEGRLADTSFEVALSENESAALARLEQRVMTLTQMVEDSVHTGSSDKALSMIRGEIAELRGHIGALATSGDIETQLQELAATISSPSGLSSDAEIDRLERQISDLSGKLDISQSQLGAIGNLENNFGSIEQEIKGLHTHMVSKAQQIAQDAVKAATDKMALGDGAEQGEAVEAAISALRLDLQSLLDASGSKGGADNHALQDVRDVLGTISNRLDNLETIRTAVGNSEISDEHQKLVGDSQISSILGAFSRGRKGTHKAQSSLPPEQKEPRNRKADFIAAARRAAKAAAKEARDSANEEKTAGNAEPKSSADKAKAPERARRLRDYINPNRTQTIEVPESMRAEKAAKTAEVLSTLQITEEPITLSADDMVSEPKLSDKEPINLSADPSEVAKADTKAKAKKKNESSSSRRKAIMLAAAAVLLTIGAFQVVNSGLFVGSDNENSAVDTRPSILAPDAELPGKDNTSLLSGDVDAVVASDTMKIASAPPPEGEIPAPVSSTSIWQNGSATAPSEPTGELVFGKATQLGPVTAAQPEAVDPITTASVPDTATSLSEFEKQARPQVILQAPAENAEPKQSAYHLPYAIGPVQLRSAAAAGDASAQFEVARRYTEGNLVPADFKAAANWYRKAAAQGLALAQFRLGTFYKEGRGVEKDLDQARNWLTLAADQGNIKAMHNLAVLFVEGIDGKPDYTSAIPWFEKAAEYGVADSSYNLALIAARGLGRKQDLVESYKWFALAAMNGDEEAIASRDNIAAELTKNQLVRALEAVANFKTRTVDPAANDVVVPTEWSGKPKATISQGSSPSVKKLQQALLNMGYDPGNPDGVMGPNTRRAIKSLQARLGMETTGVPDSDLMMALTSRTI